MLDNTTKIDPVGFKTLSISFVAATKELIYFFNTLNLFALPILYNPNTTPTWLKKIFMLNPFSYLVICWQDILFKNFVPDLFIWAIGFFFSLLIFFIGLLIYKKSKSFLGDYI